MQTEKQLLDWINPENPDARVTGSNYEPKLRLFTSDKLCEIKCDQSIWHEDYTIEYICSLSLGMFIHDKYTPVPRIKVKHNERHGFRDEIVNTELALSLHKLYTEAKANKKKQTLFSTFKQYLAPVKT